MQSIFILSVKMLFVKPGFTDKLSGNTVSPNFLCSIFRIQWCEELPVSVGE